MKQSERRLLWQSRIESFQASGEPSVAAWCSAQEIPVQSMYQWLRKLRTQTESTQWLPVVTEESLPSETPRILLKVQDVTIECPTDFDEATLTKVLQVVHQHVY